MSYRNTGGTVNSDQTGIMGKTGKEFSKDATETKKGANEHNSDSQVDENRGSESSEPKQANPSGPPAYIRMSGAQTDKVGNEQGKLDDTL